MLRLGIRVVPRLSPILLDHVANHCGVSVVGMFRETPPIWACLAWLFAYLVGFLWMATRVVERKEYILEQ